MQNDILIKLSNYPWFHPEGKIFIDDIEEAVVAHQKQFSPFGLTQVYSFRLVKIWPGQDAEAVFAWRAEGDKALLHMFSENAVQMIRDVALDHAGLDHLDFVLRDQESKITTIIKQAAIDAAGLTVKATVAISGNDDHYIAELDMVEKATEDAVKAASWYSSWQLMQDYLEGSYGYFNPFAPLMALFAMGLWPIGVVNEQYIVLFPSQIS